jgi:hypothetical protein
MVFSNKNMEPFLTKEIHILSEFFSELEYDILIKMYQRKDVLLSVTVLFLLTFRELPIIKMLKSEL